MRVFSDRLLYTEARAALAQAQRMDRISETQLAKSVDQLDSIVTELDWVEITEHLGRSAGELAQAHALRGYDAVHLAATALAAEQYGNCRINLGTYWARLVPMALSIKSERADQLARDLAALTGESITEAVVASLEARLDEEHRRRRRAGLGDIVERFAQLPVLDRRGPDDILDYDENGLPS